MTDPEAAAAIRTLRADLAAARAEAEALRTLLREARTSWIKVGYGASHEDIAECRDFCDCINTLLRSQ